jgi:hypothetical protein
MLSARHNWDALHRLLSNPDCSSFLSPDAGVAASTLEDTTYTIGDLNKVNGTPTAVGTAAEVINSTLVYINSNPDVSPFFSQNIFNPSTGQFGNFAFDGLTGADFDAFVLLHELAHQTGVFGADTGNQQLENQENQDIVNKLLQQLGAGGSMARLLIIMSLLGAQARYSMGASSEKELGLRWKDRPTLTYCRTENPAMGTIRVTGAIIFENRGNR